MNLKLLSYKAGFRNAGDFLASFVGDLTCWHSNGSDERDKADDWYERAFGMSKYYSNFRYHLFDYDYCIDDMKEMIEDNDFFEDAYESYVAENSGKTNLNRDECREVLAEIISAGMEL